MKLFEVSSRSSKNGRRKFKAILHEIYPDNCVDELNEAGTKYNDNGITWIREYCERALPTISNMFIRVEFADPKERDEILGHGMTGIEDDLPIYEDAVTIGNFTRGYIDEITDVYGDTKTVCIGEGYIDEMCYKRFVSKLMDEIDNNENPFGSVEIYKSENNEAIVYKYGYKEYGRIPTDFIYSGYALLGVRPADKSAKILELNSKGDARQMNESEIKALITDTVNEMSNHVSEMNEYKQNCDAQVAEANSQRDQAIAEKNEADSKLTEIETELTNCRNTITERDNTISELNSTIESLKSELNQMKVEKRIEELNAALSEFTDDERSFAKDEIEAFKNDPMNFEINTITSKICVNIVKKAKADEEAKKIAEQNESESLDIYGFINTDDNKEEEVSIY